MILQDVKLATTKKKGRKILPQVDLCQDIIKIAKSTEQEEILKFQVWLEMGCQTEMCQLKINQLDWRIITLLEQEMDLDNLKKNFLIFV